MGTMRPSWEIAPYFAFIDVHFVLSQASISLTIAKQGRGACVQRRPPAAFAHTLPWNEGFFLDRLPEIKIPISLYD